MPIYVEWKWEEPTQSLLAIFHFYDDFSKPNLRLVKIGEEEDAYVSSRGELTRLKRAWTTWAPSHSEIALLMQLLCYANIINGLRPTKKRKLWNELEGKKAFRDSDFSQNELANIAVPDEIKKQIGLDKRVMTYADLEEEDVLRTCVELCPEYVDYLKKVLKPYIAHAH